MACTVEVEVEVEVQVHTAQLHVQYTGGYRVCLQ
jgi:hypothetical protein